MASSKAKRVKRKMGSAKHRVETHTSGFTSKVLKPLPEGMERFNPKTVGPFRFDILPYVVGKGNVLAEEGSLYYERTFYTHGNVGPNNDRYVCPARTFQKKCPICEAGGLARREGADKEAMKAFNTSERNLFLIQEYDLKGNKVGGPKLFDISFYCFGKLLDARIKQAEGDDDFENFFYPDKKNGRTLKVTFEMKPMGGGITFAEAKVIDFKPRKYDYPDELPDELPCLDDLLIQTSYKGLKEAFEGGGGGSEDGDDDEKPKKKKKKPEVDDDDDDAESDGSDDDDEDDGDGDSEEESDEDEDEDGEDDDDGDSEDEDDEESDDEDEESDEEDDSDSEEDEDDGLIAGDKVRFTHKGKKGRGTVKKVNSAKGLVTVKSKAFGEITIKEMHVSKIDEDDVF